jgi:UDP-glucose 4-epimerase
MNWLVTGGAGYIGAHVTRALQASGRGVVVLDDLSTGQAERLPAGVKLVRASVLDQAAVRDVLERNEIAGVIHLAAKKSPSESMTDAGYYYEQNVVGLQRLLTAMHSAGVGRVVFSSSSSVYGESDTIVDEGSPTVPLSPYGWSKLAGEDIIRTIASITPLRWIALRYFNVVGAGAPGLGDTSVSNLVPMTFRALDEGARPQIFGTNHPTPDGTCVRDYVHVEDVADAHVTAAAHLEELSETTGSVYNIGTGVGTSVRELLEAIRVATGRTFEVEYGPRRAGDPHTAVASVKSIEKMLDWRAERGLAEMMRSAWAMWRAAEEHGGSRAR